MAQAHQDLAGLTDLGVSGIVFYCHHGIVFPDARRLPIELAEAVA